MCLILQSLFAIRSMSLQKKMVMFYSKEKVVSVDNIAVSIKKRFSMASIERKYHDIYLKAKSFDH